MSERIIPGCEVLPPLESPEDRERRNGGGAGKREPKGSRKQSAGRFQSLNAFVDFTLRELSGTEAKVWLILFRDARGGTARTSQADIARRAGISERQAIRVIERLKRRGLLKLVYRGRLNSGPSSYRVLPLGEPGAW